MKLIRYEYQGSAPAWGALEGDDIIALEGNPFEGLRRGAVVGNVAYARLLAPVQPSKIICIGRNYAAHAAELGNEVPKEPLIFLKPPSSIIGPGEAIVLPALSQRVEHEAELVVVIGKKSRHLTEENAMEAVFGYTCGNDVTARDLQRSDGQWSRAKGFDTFCPIGPVIVTADDYNPASVAVECHVNDESRQAGNTRDLIFSLPRLLKDVSAVFTLEPGDILMTGTPAGVSPLLAGDRVTVTVEGIGTLENKVIA
jgi:2-keto-4-pentenoate hydratase/2-oxohepta-3-ene-1,7-dioic acid hydratase in catechol pathway